MQFFSNKHRNHDGLAKGLLEEANEVNDAEANGTRKELLDELGDVLWYVTVMANQEGSSLEEIMKLNHIKLEDRALNGKR